MIEVRIPKLGLTMENATLIEWRYNSGEHVKRDDVIAIIETEKVTYEITAPADGILFTVVEEGTVCMVQELIAYIAESPEEYEQISGKTAPSTPSKEKPLVHEQVNLKEKRIKASPLARAIAKEHGIDLKEIKGTGPGGRIVKRDVLIAIEETKKIPPEPGIQKEPLEVIPIRGIRKVIFDNMFMSLSQSAQLTLHASASAEAIVRLRDRFNQVGKRVSYNAIFIKITAAALRIHPNINASVEGDKIKVWKQINIGFAMEKDDALIVPVIKNPDTKSIIQIEEEMTELIERARENALNPDDLSNGTFTITNLGFSGIEYFTPIIRPPESAILGIGAIRQEPIVKDGKVVPDKRVGLSLTFDHRIIDGAPASRFLKTIIEIIEEPMLMLVEGENRT